MTSLGEGLFHLLDTEPRRTLQNLCEAGLGGEHPKYAPWRRFGLGQNRRRGDIIAHTTEKHGAIRNWVCTEENVVTEPSIVYCAHCGAAVTLPSSFCGACGQPLQNATPPAPVAQAQNPQPQSPQPVYGSAPQSPAVQCPFCHSSQVQAGKRGWKWYAGYVGSSNVVWTCQSCGKTF
jgi:hypothetical protein